MTVRPVWGVRGYYCYKTNIGWGRGGHGICFAHHLLPLNLGAVALFKKSLEALKIDKITPKKQPKIKN